VNAFNVVFVSLPGILRHALTPAMVSLLNYINRCLRALFEQQKK